MKLDRLWRELLIGVFFLDGMYASLQVSPLGTVFGMVDNTTLEFNHAFGTPVVNTSRIYLYASIGIEILGVVIGFMIAGLLGLVAIALAYGSGYSILGDPILGIAMFAISVILFLLGRRGKRKSKELREKDR